MRLILNIILLLITLPAWAALEVYDSTCAVPKAPVHKWYFDAVAGDDSLGDGSVLKPWKSLGPVFNGTTIAAVPATPAAPAKPLIYIGAKYQAIPSFYGDATGHRVWGSDPKAPIKPGDALELATGNYGAMAAGVYTYGINPDQFLTIEPASATAKPVFTSIKLSGMGHMYFHDIKVQNVANGGSLVSMGAQGALPMVDYAIADKPATDIILDRMTFSGTDADPATWTADDWNTKPANGVWIYPGSSNCISVTNSNFSAVAGGSTVGGQKMVFSHNKINYFRDDGVDFYGNDLRMTYNTLTNSVATTAIHKDFFQGQIGRRIPGTTVNHYRNIVIDHNTMIGKTEAKNAFYTYTQGINTFDEDWTNLKATNNIIIAASCHGIGFSSVHTGEIANNVVLHDLLTVTTGCARGTIGAGGSSHEGTISDHIHVHHNITQNIFVDLDHANTWDNNVLTGNDAQYTPLQNGVINWGYQPPVGDVNNNKLDRQFTRYNPAAYQYNVTAQAGSLAQVMKAGPQ